MMWQGRPRHKEREEPVEKLGHQVVLLPPQQVRPYVTERDRSDRRQGDPRGLWKRRHPGCPGEVPQQVLVSLHRFRSGWIASRTAQINTLRGLLRELDLVSPVERDTTRPHRHCTGESPDGETGRTGKQDADNKRGPERPPSSIGSPCAHSIMARSPRGSTPEAEDTFAVPTYLLSRAHRGVGLCLCGFSFGAD